MAALRPRPARSPRGSRPETRQYAIAASQTFLVGDPLEFNGSNQLQVVSGADPTPIVGFAAANAADVIETGFCEVWMADDETIFAVQGNTAPVAATHVGNDYGLVVDADGVWLIDPSETTNILFSVVDVDTVNELYFVKVLAADRAVI